MKKYIIATAVTILCASVCIAATYTIKTKGGVTTIKPPASSTSVKTQTTNYNTYSSGQYVSSNTVNSSYAEVIDIVMDFSGSMSDVVNVAKATMSSVVAQIPPSTQVGFRVFGQGDFVEQPKLGEVKKVEKTTNSKGKTVYKLNIGKHKSSGFFGGSGCRATHLVTPISSANANALIAGMNSVELGGSTPMVYALEEAVKSDLSKYSRDIPKKIVLITDGGENCGGDACSFAKTLMATRRDIQVDVVLVSSSSSKLRCLAQTTGGKVYNLSNVRDFAKVLSTSINTPVNQNQTPIDTQEQNQGQNYEYIEE